MTSDISSEEVVAEDLGIVQENLALENHHVVENPATVEEGQDAVVAAERQQGPDDDKESAKDRVLWMALRTVYFVLIYIVLVIGMMVVVFLKPDDDEKRSRRDRDEQATELSEARLLPAPASSSPSVDGDESITVPTTFRKTIARKARSKLYYAPHCFFALWIAFAVKVAAPPRQDQHKCVARQAETGFQGNADMYGLGIRLGIYLQWVSALLAVKSVPSAREFVVSSYLFTQFAMIVAMCLLLLPGTCTFTAEVLLTLQFLWGGSAAVLVPSQRLATRYNAKSRFLGIDVISSIMGVWLFMFVIWFISRFWLRGEWDFTETPGGTHGFWAGPFGPDGVIFMGRMQAFWVWLTTLALFDIYCDKPRIHLFTNFMDWNWWTAATMTTGGMVYPLQAMAKFVVVFPTAGKLITGRFKEEPDMKDVNVLVLALHYFCRACTYLYMNWYWIFRNWTITFWAFLSIEYLLQENNVEGVRDLNTTGQILPLSIGVVTLLYVLYMWVKSFFGRTSSESTPEITPLALEQAVGFPTPSGRWI